MKFKFDPVLGKIRSTDISQNVISGVFNFSPSSDAVYNAIYQAILENFGAVSNEFYYKVPSDVIGMYKSMQLPSLGLEQTFTTADLSNSTDTIIATFITEPEEPGTLFQQPGIISSYLTARKSFFNSEDIQLFAKYYSCDTLGGNPILMGTSSLSPLLTDLNSSFSIQASISNGFVTLITDRRYTEIIARTGSSGPTTSVVLTIENNMVSRTTLPSAILAVNNFLPYSGATKNIDLGSKDILTTGNISFTTQAVGDISTFGATTEFVSKAKEPKTQEIISDSDVTPTFEDDFIVVTAQEEALQLYNPTGIVINNKKWIIRIKDNGMPIEINYDSKYRAIGITLPITTITSKWLYLFAYYNDTDDKVDIVDIKQEI